MGNSAGKLDQADLEIYQLLTYFNKAEIIDCADKFFEMIESNPETSNVAAAVKERRLKLQQVKMPFSVIENKISALHVNPFGTRLLQVFSGGQTLQNGESCILFEDFLNMMSIMGPSAPLEVKAKWAFKVYDFNNDEKICSKDILEVVKRLTKPNENSAIELKPEELAEVVKNVLEETDLNNNGFITSTEFQQVATKSPEFQHSFKLSI
ncbi:calcium and integrin-binding family member 3 [Eurytemora carolleeae]|uniref:calcium and integrin-binding family member 3 n=1 Tax=Eurytemora carolleeae TaxID=1294199 RepID=UPI000C792A2C|nr:calcium and integrin-binding family member 3 [Eurytemora carolleeae]|eukprot:XP_023340538.1 calcium and integrin-binding family member 3-like [Eurytemora affinis]